MNDTITDADHPTRAEELFEAGRFEAALPAWQALADADPDAVRPRARVAACLLALGRYDRARAVLEPLVSAHSEEPALLVRLAAAHAGAGDADAAFETLARAAAAGARLEMGLDREVAFDSIRHRARFADLRARIEANAHRTADDPLFRVFDFWVGSWEARTEDGVLHGHNRIERVLGGAALVETWTGASGYRGTSLNRVDRRTGTWRQTWVDDQGDVVEFEDGVVSDGQMVFHARDAEGGLRRLTFEDRGPNAVRQLSEQSEDDGKTWTVEYDFRYRRIPADAEDSADGERVAGGTVSDS